MVQAGHRLPPRGGRAQDGHGAIDRAGNCGAGFVAANISKPDRAALADPIGAVLASLRNHRGKGVERANEGAPARWRLKETANSI